MPQTIYYKPNIDITREPTEYDVLTIPTADLFVATKTFLDEYYKDTAEFYEERGVFGVVRLSPSGLAYLIKIITNATYKRQISKTVFSLERGRVVISLYHTLDDDFLRKIRLVAEKTGLTLNDSKPGHLTLHIDLEESKSLQIYARDQKLFGFYLNIAFFF